MIEVTTTLFISEIVHIPHDCKFIENAVGGIKERRKIFMNKLFTKIGVAIAGIAMAVGVGVAVGSKEVKEAKADTGDATINSFTAASAELDDYVQYNSYRNGGTSNPAPNNGVLRIYQKDNSKNVGGTLLITPILNSGSKIKKVSITSTLASPIGYVALDKHDSNNASDFSTTTMTANTAWTSDDDLNADAFTIACLGTGSGTRLYVSSLTVWYTYTPSGKTSTTTTISSEDEKNVLDITTAEPDTASLSVSVTYGNNSVENPAITWSVLPAGVVSLSSESGESITVTALAKGNATITASYAGDNNYNASSGEFEITVLNPNEKTYSLKFGDGIVTETNWTNSYGEHNGYTYNETGIGTLTFNFAAASKQTGTITDYPVGKQGAVEMVLSSTTYYISSVRFNGIQWGTKTQTMSINYSINGGSSYTSSGASGSNFTVSKDNLPVGTNAIQISFSSDNQVGHKSFEVLFAETPVLSSVTTSGQKVSFAQNEVFAYNGTLTAHYTQGKADAPVSPASFKYGTSETDPYTAGTSISVGTTLTVDTHNGKYIFVGYEEDDITKWTAGYEITVAYASVESLTLTSNTGKVAQGQGFNLENAGITISPANANQGHTWEYVSDTVSGDYTINGTTITAGSTDGTITYKCKADGNNAVYQTFVLTISSNPVVSLPNSVSLYTGKTTTVAATVTGGSEPYTYSWSITDGGNKATITSGGTAQTVTLRGDAAGSVTLRCDVTDDDSKTDHASVTFSVTASAVTSVNWSASAYDVWSGDTIPANIDSTWQVNYEKNNGDSGNLSFGGYTLMLGEKEIESLPYSFVADDNGEDLYVIYGGVESTHVDVTVTQTIQSVMAESITKHESSLAFTAKCGGTGTSDGGEGWTVDSDATSESDWDSSRGIHYGSNSISVQYITLTSNDFNQGKITKIVVNASTGSGVTATVGVTVGGNQFGGQPKSLTSSAADYTFNGEIDADEIVVTITKASSATKALFCKSIVVTYATSSGSHDIANDDASTKKAAQRAVVKFARAFNAAMDTTEGCTTGLSSAWSTASAAWTTFLSDIAAEGVDADYARSLIANATAQWVEEQPDQQGHYASDSNYLYCLERALATYEKCVSEYDQTAFMSDVRPVGRINYSPLGLANDTNTITVIIVISLTSLAAIGGYFFLRRRKAI